MTAGTQAQALTSDTVMLDFTGLFDNGTEAAQSRTEPIKESGEYKCIPTEKNGLKGQYKAAQEQAPAKALLQQKQQQEEEHQRTLSIYQTYRENMRKSGQLQTEILKGIQAGEDIYSLFLKATEAIGCMTDCGIFGTITADNIKSIYGEGLLQKQPLQLQLEETETRLIKLEEAGQREIAVTDKQRIQAAIKAHKERIAELENLIEKAT